jgi:hypothetical protein
MRNLLTVLFGQPKARDHFGDTGMDRRIILKWILKKRWEDNVTEGRFLRSDVLMW